MLYFLAISLGLTVVLLNSVICTGAAGLETLPSRCFLLDVDVSYNSSELHAVDLQALNNTFRISVLTQFVTNHWLLGETKCTGVNVIYHDLKQRVNGDRKLVLIATYLYENQLLDDEKLADAKLRGCIDTMVDKHRKYSETLNLLTSVPTLTSVSGKKIKAHSTTYGNNTRPCCFDTRNCCPKGSTLVPNKNYDLCECNPGFYYEASRLKCQPCLINTYKNKSGMTACEPCPKNYTTAGEGAMFCIPVLECKYEVKWEVQGIFHWENMKTGSRAQHACPYGPRNAIVERKCYLDSHSMPLWEKLNLTRVCNSSKRTASLLELSMRPVNETNAFEISQRLVVETLMGQELNAYDVALATSSLNAIIGIEKTLVMVSDDVVKVLDNILMAKDETLSESQTHNRTTSRLLSIIQTFAENIPLLNGSRSLVGTNLELHIQFFTSQATLEGFSFNVKSKDFKKVILGKSTTQAVSQMTVNPEAFQSAMRQTSKRLVSIVYRNIKLFPMVHRTEKLEVGNGEVVRPGVWNQVGSVVLAGKFKDASIERVEDAVELSFAYNTENYWGKAPICVYWDFRANNGFGNWSSRGCHHVATKSGVVTCRCNHMTNFAMLLTADPDRHESDESHRNALNIISYIGCGVSLLAATLTFLTYALFRINTQAAAKVINKEGKVVTIHYLRRSNAQLILCHLCVALIGLLLSFLVVANLTPNTTTCRVFSVFVHYFLLTTLTWMGVEGINMYLAFVKVMSAHVPRFMPKAVAISWGIPVIVVLVTGFTAFDSYSSEKSCFIHGLVFYLSVFAPAIVIVLVNFIMFGLTIYSLSQMGKKVSQENRIQGYQRAKVALAIMVLLGLTWIFGAMAIGNARLLFQYVFCILNSFQGLAIFWFHCVGQAEVRECWLQFLCQNGSRKRRYTTSTTVPVIKKCSTSANVPSNQCSMKDNCDDKMINTKPNQGRTGQVYEVKL